MTKTRQPKEMHAKFPGKCAKCGRHVDVGETILWLARGKIECSHCIDTTKPRETPSDRQTGDKWANALSWHIEPSKPVAIVAPSTPKPESIPIVAPITPTNAQRKIIAERMETADLIPPDSDSADLPELDPQAQTVCDLLVTLINATDLDTSQDTLWGALNAVTNFIDFEMRARTIDNRFASSQFGDGLEIKRKAFDEALALAA